MKISIKLAIISFLLGASITASILHYVLLKHQHPICGFDFHINYSVEGEGIIIYDYSGTRRVGSVYYKEAGTIDSLLENEIFGKNTMPLPKALN